MKREESVIDSLSEVEELLREGVMVEVVIVEREGKEEEAENELGTV